MKGKKTKKNTEKLVEQVVLKGKGKKKAATTEVIISEENRKRKAAALNPFSCCHSVFMELHGMEKHNMNHYLNNGYLQDKCCKDCHKTCVDLVTRPADKQKHFIYYCDPGIMG
jgi:hypothetical protein